MSGSDNDMINWYQWDDEEFEEEDYDPEMEPDVETLHQDGTITFAARSYHCCIEHPMPLSFDPEWICYEVSHREARARCMFCHNVGAWMVINDKSNFDVELSYDMFCDTCLCNKLYIPAVEMCNDHGWAKSFYFERRPFNRTKNARSKI